MLVANGVVGDSRVQKVAWSMAAKGWDVTLVGRSPGEGVVHYGLGGARVILVPVPKTVSGYERTRVRGGGAAADLRPNYRHARALLASRDAAPSSRARSRTSAAARRWLVEHPAVDDVLAASARGPVGGSLHKLVGGSLGLTDRYGGWRWFNPWFADLELAFAPVVKEIDPDLIHAHDFHMVGMGARLAAELSTPERRVRWIYDAHEYLRGIEVPKNSAVRARMRRRMLVGVEREYIGLADGVVTVSEGIATKLAEDHRLRRRPHVILNAPVIAAISAADKAEKAGSAESADTAATTSTRRSLRADCALADDVPLLLYSGGMSPRRGVATVIDALAHLPEAHLALIAREDDPDIPALRDRARAGGVADRLHVLPYVPVDEVVRYISSATIGLVPILHLPNHELSLITKYFEYLHAALPIVTSDVREMAAETRRLNVGEVFTAGDPKSLADAVGRVLADLGSYRAVYQGSNDPRPSTSWAGQADRLDALYREILGTDPGPARPAGELRLEP
jgi:glycosyltransferase involved in cell wall biosynthesis